MPALQKDQDARLIREEGASPAEGSTRMTRKTGLLIIVAAFACQIVLAQKTVQSATSGSAEASPTGRMEDGAVGTAKVESDELSITLQDGRTISGAEWHIVGDPKQTNAGGERTLTVRLTSDKAPGLVATVTYRVQADEAWMRKDVVLTGPADLVVTQVDLEPMTVRPVPADHGGEGMPLLIDGHTWLASSTRRARTRSRLGASRSSTTRARRWATMASS